MLENTKIAVGKIDKAYDRERNFDPIVFNSLVS